MPAIKKEELARLEAEHGLSEDDLTYQQRCSRITAVMKGEEWSPDSKKEEPKRGTIRPAESYDDLTKPVPEHPLFGKKLIITPKMVPDKNRNVYFDEPVGPEIEVEEIHAGALLHGQPEDVDRISGSYKIIKKNPNRTVTAKTTLPKSGQEISFTLGKDLVPVVEGNDGQKGYVWSMPTHMRRYENTMIQVYGLKTLIQQVFPELLPKFSGKPVMMYVDGLVLAASIPQTDAILKEHRRREIQDAKLGLD